MIEIENPTLFKLKIDKRDMNRTIAELINKLQQLQIRPQQITREILETEIKNKNLNNSSL